MAAYRFRPRYRGMAWSAIGVGGGLGAIGAVAGAAMLPIVAGAIGVVFGAAYLVSPTWKFEVHTDEAGLEVRSGATVKFRLAWSEVVKLVVATGSPSAFVDGGDSTRSLLVPGDGAPAPYEIENASALVAELTAHVASDRIERRVTLDQADAAPPAS